METSEDILMLKISFISIDCFFLFLRFYIALLLDISIYGHDRSNVLS